MRPVQVCRALAPLLEKKMTLRSMESFFGQIIRGLRTLPVEWEQPLLTVTGCTNRMELQRLYPKMKFRTTGEEAYEIAVTFSETIAKVPGVRVLEVIRALQLLQEFGIKNEARIRIA